MVDLLLVLDLERIGGQHHPQHFEDGDEADEAWFLFGELACDDFRRTCRLDWIILYRIR
jgi:hypothetical protein